MQPRPVSRWGLLWRSRNRLDGEQTHIITREGMPAMFRTREDARAFAERDYGYIKRRCDLRAEPHGWRMPVAVRLTIAAQGIEARQGGDRETGRHPKDESPVGVADAPNTTASTSPEGNSHE